MTQAFIEKLYHIFRKHPEVTTDSRNCPEGSMFFALKGENFNGNKFAAAALEKGCAYAVIDEPDYNKDDRYILTDNVLKTLQALAKYHRNTFNIPVIAITGTNGKTTTKELIAEVLSRKFNTHFTKGNFNNHIGVPLTLLKLNTRHEMAVIEMGANHPGEIKELCDIAEPDFGIITNIGKAHLEGFGSFKAVIKTKKELFDFIKSKRGKLFVNRSNTLLVENSKDIETIWYGGDKDDIQILDDKTSHTLTLIAGIDDARFKVHTNLTGQYNLENIQAACKIGQYFGVDGKKISDAIAEYQPSNNRSQILKTNINTLILDMYNANPTSMKAAILEFLRAGFPNKVLILGDMKELGPYSEAEHRSILELFENYDNYHLICIGKEFFKFNTEFPKIEFYKTTKEAFNKIDNNPIKDASILLKGSRSMQLEKLLGKL